MNSTNQKITLQEFSSCIRFHRDASFSFAEVLGGSAELCVFKWLCRCNMRIMHVCHHHMMYYWLSNLKTFSTFCDWHKCNRKTWRRSVNLKDGNHGSGNVCTKFFVQRKLHLNVQSTANTSYFLCTKPLPEATDRYSFGINKILENIYKHLLSEVFFSLSYCVVQTKMQLNWNWRLIYSMGIAWNSIVTRLRW